MHTYLCHDGINQLTLRQGEIEVEVVRMICTHLAVVVWAKSCPGMHSSCAIASSSKLETCLLLWLCSHSWPFSEIKRVAKELINGNYWSLTWERKSWLSINGRGL